jgi:hypothetical protein
MELAPLHPSGSSMKAQTVLLGGFCTLSPLIWTFDEPLQGLDRQLKEDSYRFYVYDEKRSGGMMNYRSTLVFVIIAALCGLYGCSGTLNTKRSTSFDKSKYRTAYIIDTRESTVVGYSWVPVVGLVDGDKSKHEPVGNTPVHIKNALAKHGILAYTGTGKTAPKNVDLVVVYKDEWQWDLKMYMRKLEIKIYDNKTRQLIGSGYYQSGGGGFHDYPTSEREAPNIIDGIFNGK